TALRQARHSALEAVAVEVREPGKKRPVTLVAALRRNAGFNRCDAAFGDGKPHLGLPAFADPGAFEPICRHPGSLILCLDIMTRSHETVQMDLCWTNARLATMTGDGLGLIDDGVLAAREGRIIYAGPASDAPAGAMRTVDCGGRLITPGLIDCHTHLVHAGSRANEWAMRLEGASY